MVKEALVTAVKYYFLDKFTKQVIADIVVNYLYFIFIIMTTNATIAIS